MTDPRIQGPHRRHDPLRDSWVLVSGGRRARPWLGQIEPLPAVERPAYDPECALCPGNLRSSGARNPGYAGTFVFEPSPTFGAELACVAPGIGT